MCNKATGSCITISLHLFLGMMHHIGNSQPVCIHVFMLQYISFLLVVVLNMMMLVSALSLAFLRQNYIVYHQLVFCTFIYKREQFSSLNAFMYKFKERIAQSHANLLEANVSGP